MNEGTCGAEDGVGGGAGAVVGVGGVRHAGVGHVQHPRAERGGGRVKETLMGGRSGEKLYLLHGGLS